MSSVQPVLIFNQLILLTLQVLENCNPKQFQIEDSGTSDEEKKFKIKIYEEKVEL